jgi:hypothetical protein
MIKDGSPYQQLLPGFLLRLIYIYYYYYQAICADETTRAVSNLEEGKICGKRDSRYF